MKSTQIKLNDFHHIQFNRETSVIYGGKGIKSEAQKLHVYLIDDLPHPKHLGYLDNGRWYFVGKGEQDLFFGLLKSYPKKINRGFNKVTQDKTCYNTKTKVFFHKTKYLLKSLWK